MGSIPISEFRRRCLRLLEQLPAEGLTITKKGRPVARVAPVHRSLADFIGALPDLAADPADDLFTTGRTWDAQSRYAHRPRRGAR